MPSTRSGGLFPRREKGTVKDPATGSGPAVMPRLALAPRRRARPYLLLGVVLAIGGAFAFASAYSHLGGRRAVLELVHPVTAGQRFAASDLRSVQVAADGGVPLIPLADASLVIGHPAAMSLPAGTLLSKADLGAATLPAGQTMVAVSVKAGAYPSELASGARVAVAVVPQAGQSGASGTPVVVASLPRATVVSTTAASDSSGSVSVSLLAEESDAGQIASIPAGQVQLIVVSSADAATAGGG